MRDRDVREALRRKVFSEHIKDPQTLVVEELGLSHGDARIDIAVVNGRLHGYEIKSDADTLLRLPLQIMAYNSVFDRVTMVAGSKHSHEVAAMIPDWWGLKVATTGPRGAVHFEEVRPPRSNPEIDPIHLARLLWRQEAMRILEAKQVKGIKSKSRAQLYAMLASALDLSELRAAVRAALKTREGWRSDAQRVPCAD